MSKKHFIAFAARIAKMTDRTAARECAEMVIEVQENPRFDKARFLSACGF